MAHASKRRSNRTKGKAIIGEKISLWRPVIAENAETREKARTQDQRYARLIPLQHPETGAGKARRRVKNHMLAHTASGSHI